MLWRVCTGLGLSILAMTLMLAACTTGGRLPVPPPAVAARTSCPPVKSYSAAEQKALADALRPLAETSPLVLAMRDYATLRDASRACAGTAP